MKSLVTREVADLVPYARNSRTHSEAQIAQIAASITEFGFTNPVLIDDQNTIIAGYGRVLAAQSLKLPSVPCVVLPGLTEPQKAAYGIADNKLALGAGWDEQALVDEFKRLDGLEFDLHLTGFTDVEIAALLEEVGAEVPEALAVAEPDAESSQVGDGDTEDDANADSSQPSSGASVPNAARPQSPGPTEPQEEWKAMPDFNQPDAGAFRTLHVHFKDQAAVDAFAKLLGLNITDKTKFVWYPEVARAAATHVYA